MPKKTARELWNAGDVALGAAARALRELRIRVQEAEAAVTKWQQLCSLKDHQMVHQTRQIAALRAQITKLNKKGKK